MTTMDMACTVDLADVGLIAFEGDDTVNFLQGQLTNDARKLDASQAQYSGLCSPKGRLLGSFMLWQQNGCYLMQLPAELQASLQKRLSMYILRSKVKARDACAEYAQLGCAGQNAAEVINQVFACVLDADMQVQNVAGVSVIRLSQSRYQLSVPMTDKATILAKLAVYAETMTTSHWHWLTIQAGVPTITAATQEQFVPQMVNFDLTNSVNFQKGCYTGQEIVARTQYLGKLKRRMYLVHSDIAMAAGDEIYSADMEGQAMGMIVNAEAAPAGGWDALAVMQISSVAAESLHLKSLDGAVLSLQNLPYAL
jgi:hypothetical protein